MINLSTRYLGFSLPHPFISGAGPLADTLDGARRLEDAGAAAVVLRSLFAEQIEAESLATSHAIDAPAESFAEAVSYFPEPEEFILGPDRYLDHLARVAESLEVPVIASLNGHAPGRWLDYARRIEEAGADALELNLYHVPLDPEESGAAIEERALDIVQEITSSTELPIAVKLSPFYTSLPHFARRLEAAGAHAVIVFNRFFEPEVDADELEVRPTLELSSAKELPLRLRWLAILSGVLQSASLAVTGGVHSGGDAARAILCGASAVQVVSSLLRGGVGRLGDMRTELAAWMEAMEYETLSEMRGALDIEHTPDPRSYARANYIRSLQTWTAES